MKVVFLTNFYNHHQAPFATAMDRLTDGHFEFVGTEAMPAERISLGYKMDTIPDYAKAYNEKEDFDKLVDCVDSADVVITGIIPDRRLNRSLKKKKIVFRYSERVFKKEFKTWKLPYYVLRHCFRVGRHRNEYLLCASAFTAADCCKMGFYKNKAYKWGYFPQAKQNDIGTIIANKKPHSILWVARFIDWKHPEVCLELAKRLLQDGIDGFHIDMIGNGTMLEQIKERIISERLVDNVSAVGSMTPDKVRLHMEESEIFVFTSDRNEGWGAVLNEAMNSGCAVVTSSEIGAVPYLVNDGENGLIYQDGNVDDLYEKVKDLYFDAEKRKKFGTAAYHTIVDMWNADVAAERLLFLIDDLEKTGSSNRYSTGPCSKAEIVKDGWYKG